MYCVSYCLSILKINENIVLIMTSERTKRRRVKEELESVFDLNFFKFQKEKQHTIACELNLNYNNSNFNSNKLVENSYEENNIPESYAEENSFSFETTFSNV